MFLVCCPLLYTMQKQLCFSQILNLRPWQSDVMHLEEQAKLSWLFRAEIPSLNRSCEEALRTGACIRFKTQKAIFPSHSKKLPRRKKQVASKLCFSLPPKERLILPFVCYSLCHCKNKREEPQVVNMFLILDNTLHCCKELCSSLSALMFTGVRLA